MRRLFSLIFILSTVSIGILKAQPTVTLSNVEAQAGSTVDIDLVINGFGSSYDYSALQFIIYYDSTHVNLTEIDFSESPLKSLGTTISNPNFSNNLPTGPYKGAQVGMYSQNYLTANGLLAKLKFDVKKTANSQIMFVRALYGGANDVFTEENISGGIISAGSLDMNFTPNAAPSNLNVGDTTAFKLGINAPYDISFDVLSFEAIFPSDVIELTASSANSSLENLSTTFSGDTMMVTLSGNSTFSSSTAIDLIDFHLSSFAKGNVNVTIQNLKFDGAEVLANYPSYSANVNNYAVDDFEILMPTSDDTVTIDALLEGALMAKWSKSQDQDGTDPTYSYKLAADAELSTVLYTENTSDTTLSLGFPQLYQILVDAGITTPGTYPMYHTVVSSDGSSSAMTDTVMFTAKLEEVNTLPTAPVILTPANGASVTIEGDTLAVVNPTWSESTDLDGGSVSYTWQLAADAGFSTVLFSTNTGPETGLTLTYKDIAQVLSTNGVEVGQSVDLYHRAVASDGTNSVPSAAAMVSITRGVLTSVDQNEIPEAFTLSQNYPNPFNPETVINYSIPTTSLVKLEVYNIMGKKISTLVNQNQASGTYNVRFNAENLSGGTYLYKLTAGNFVQIRKMTLIK